ncbi:MAG: class I tRNA ligase family protein, partial [Phycisphaeraceae bacterium]|nr:class I tRNA ligase family protein [Phycisphaeraceae bacterium]
MPEASEQLAPTYRPADVESTVAGRWNQARAFHAEASAPGDPYAVVIPPPNVTAALHLGHALNNTLQDVLVRYHRMRGENTVWLPGTDHAGIATQTVVEKRVMAEEGKRRTDFERDEFVDKIQAWKDEYEQRITDQLKEMGCSCDFDRQRFTMDPVCAAAVREAFFTLFKDGLIYRGKRLVNWDPVTQTALADDEVEMEPVDGHFWYMKYPLVDDDGAETGEYVTVATTRPETMLGDTAVAVNPNDEERNELIGRQVKLPIVNRVIPIVGDDYVVIPDDEGDERAKMASGFLKVTPAHDPNDWAIGQRHGLAVINVMAPDASISTEHGWSEEDAADADTFLADELVGTDRYTAREKIEAWFTEHDLLEGKRDHRHSVG